MATTSGRRRVTIGDVARHAGVSVSAVSKVLRDAYGVSPAMRKRVRAAIDALDYRPLATARGMRGRTYTVGVLLDTIRNVFFADILDGVDAELRAAGYQTLVGAAGFTVADQSNMARAMVDRQMDGLILIAPSVPRNEVLRLATTTPTVVIGHHDTADSHDTVVDADAEGTALLVDHLVALGHRRIALASTAGTGDNGWSGTPERLRSRGYRHAMRRHGLTRYVQVAWAPVSEPGGYQAGMELLTSPTPPTAVLAGADVAALGVYRAAHELGLRVPEDLSLAGYHNTALAALAPVQLTSVDQAGRLMGTSAARLLLERFDGRDRSVRTSISPTLVPRRTTAPPPDRPHHATHATGPPAARAWRAAAGGSHLVGAHPRPATDGGATERGGTMAHPRRAPEQDTTSAHPTPATAASVPSSQEVDLALDRAHPARMYDYYLGGTTNYPPDRQAAARALAVFPSLLVAARANRAFVLRSTRHLARAGLRQFLDLGSGIPTSPNLHEAAQRVAPESRVVYADRDPLVLTHSQALLRGDPAGRTAYVHADVTDPAALLASAELRDTLDLDRPVALSLNSLLHFIPGERTAHDLVAYLKDALAPGSTLTITHITGDFDAAAVARLEQVYRDSGTPGQARDREEFLAFFDGWELLEPGVTVTHRWRPDDEDPLMPAGVTDAEAALYAAVARKP